MKQKINDKIRLAKIIQALASGRELDQNDKNLKKEFSCSSRTIRRYLTLLESADNKVISYKKKNKESSRTVHRLLQKKDIEDILTYYLHENFEEVLGILGDNNKFLNAYIEKNPVLEKQKKKDIFFFKNQPFEDLEDEKIADYINILKIAVEKQAYKKITYLYNHNKEELEVQALRLIHVDDNWYLFIEQDEANKEKIHQQGKFRFLRLAFIEKIEDSEKKEKRIKIDKELTFIQNSLTQFHPDGKGEYKKKSLRLLAKKEVAKYFKKDVFKKISKDEEMRKFFPSQKFIKENEDGSLEFSLDYTQYLEIARFIKSFLPYIQIAKFKDEKEKTEHEAFIKDFKKDLKEMQEKLEKTLQGEKND